MYRILQAYSAAQLEKQVNELLDVGWMPNGGVACVTNRVRSLFLQAMTYDRTISCTKSIDMGDVQG